MKKINLDKLTENIYYTNVILLVLKIYYSISEIFVVPNFVSKLITFYILGTFLLSLIINTIRKKYDLKINIIEYLVVILAFYSSLVSKDFNIILTCFLIIGIKDVDLRKTIEIILKVNVIIMSIHIVLYTFAWIFKIGNLELQYNSDGEPRYCFFLNNPNQFSIILFGAYSAYVYFKYEKIKPRAYIIGLILSIFIYLFPKSRTSSIMSLLFVVLIAISKIDNKIIKKIIYFIAKYLFLIIFIFTLIFVTNFDNLKKNKFVWKMDTMLSGRIWHTNLAYKNYGLTLFGQNIDYDKVVKYDKEIILDNFYAKMILNYGIILLLILAIWFIYKNKNMKLEDCVFLIIFSIVGITEFHMSNACIGIALLIVGANHSKDDKVTKKELDDIYEGEKNGEN